MAGVAEELDNAAVRPALAVISCGRGAIAAQNVALHLDHLPSESVSSALLGNVEAEGWTSIRTPGGICPFVRLEGRWSGKEISAAAELERL